MVDRGAPSPSSPSPSTSPGSPDVFIEVLVGEGLGLGVEEEEEEEEEEAAAGVEEACSSSILLFEVLFRVEVVPEEGEVTLSLCCPTARLLVTLVTSLDC